MENIEVKKEIKKINWQRVLEYSIPAIITILISLFGIIVNSCFPFGENQVGYIDYNQGLVPTYTGLWNFFHGKCNLIVDWNLGAGGSVISSWILNSFLSPISWLIALFPKELIIHGISVLLILRLALMSTTAFICFKKLFPNVNNIILYLFTISWTFSGWTLVHFTNVGWLDLMILLPLLLLAAKDLVENGKNIWFVVILSYLLMLSYYITYMILVGVVGVGTIYIAIYAKDKKQVASKLFYSIIISILISAAAFIPSALTSLQGHRFSGTSEVNKLELVDYFAPKFVTLTMFAFPVTFFFKLLFSYKKDKKNVLFFILSFTFLIIGLFIEPINKMWHTGSYMSWPYRYSFLIVLLMIIGSLYYIDKHLQEREQESKNKLIDTNRILILVSTTMFVVMLIINAIAGVSAHPYKTAPFIYNVPQMSMLVFGWLAIEGWLRTTNKKLKIGKMAGGVIIFILCITQTIVYTGKFMGENIIESGIVTNSFEIKTDAFDRNYKLKDKDALYNHNMAYLTSFPTMQTWIHITGEAQWQAHAKLGYNYRNTRLLSSGGTLMTDMLVGNKYVLSQTSLNESFYTFIDQIDYEKKHDLGDINYMTTTYVYENTLNKSPIFTTNIDLSTILSEVSYLNSIDTQNLLFKTLYGKNENIMEEIAFTVTEDDKNFTITASVPANKNIYLENHDSIFYSLIKSNEKEILLGLTELGTFTYSQMEIIVGKEENLGKIKKEMLEEKLTFASFDTQLFVDTYSNLQQNQASITFDNQHINVKVNNTTGDKYAFIPFGNLKNMSAVNNGKQVDVLSALDGFMMVELNEGENDITLTYTPQLFKPCLIVTFVSILLFIVVSVLNKKFKLDSKKIFIYPGLCGAILILAVVAFLVYIKPFFNFFMILFS